MNTTVDGLDSLWNPGAMAPLTIPAIKAALIIVRFQRLTKVIAQDRLILARVFNR